MQLDPLLRSIHDKLTVSLRELADKSSSFSNDIGDAEGGAHRDNALSNRIAAVSTAMANTFQVMAHKAQLDQMMAAAAAGIDLQKLAAQQQASQQASQQGPAGGRG